MRVGMITAGRGCLLILAALLLGGCSGKDETRNLKSADTVFFVKRNPADSSGRFIVFRTDDPEVIKPIADKVARCLSRRERRPATKSLAGYLLLGRQNGEITYRLVMSDDGYCPNSDFEYDMRGLLEFLQDVTEDGGLTRVRSWERDRLPDSGDLWLAFPGLYVDPPEEPDGCGASSDEERRDDSEPATHVLPGRWLGWQ